MIQTRFARPLVVALVGAATLGLVSRALADEPAAALAPPVLKTFVEAEIPPGTLAPGEAARVELILTIAVDGTVQDVKVATPAGRGLDEAAAAAARRFVFEPARRGGVAIPARVRYVYAFAPPPAEPPAPPPAGRIEGRVLERGGDAPVVGAEVAVEGQDGAVVARAETGVDGTFAVDALPPGGYRVRVTALDHGGRADRETVAAGEATSVTYRLELERPASFTEGDFGATARVDAPPREVTTRKLRRDELTSVAGTRGDALRAVELLPGVARPPGTAGWLMVRGSAPWDSAVMLEGADVPLLYHFGGLTSFVPSGLLESIDFYPGNFSVKYGRKMGGVIEVGLRDPRTDRLHGIVDLNLLDSSFIAEGPVTKDISFIAAARRSYIDVWFENVVPAEEMGVTSAPVYWDWQAALAWKPTPSDRVRLSGYGSSDELGLLIKKANERDPDLRGRVSLSTGLQRGSLAWRHRYAPGIEHDVALTFGSFHLDSQFGPTRQQRIPGWSLLGRAELRAEVASWLKLTGGVDLMHEWAAVSFTGTRVGQVEGNPGKFDFSDGAMTQVDEDVAFFRPAAYVEASVRPGAAIELIGGVRADWFSDTESFALDPRLVARWTALPRLVIKGGVGRFSQPPSYPESIAGIGNAAIGPMAALHTDVGVEWTPAARATIGVDGFYKRLTNLIVDDGAGSTENAGIGRIYGLELSARLAPGGRFSGFLSYTLSRSERNDHGDAWRPFDFDQTHILSAAGQLRLGRGFTLGGTLRLISGSPTTPVVGRVYDADRDLYLPVYGTVNSERGEVFHQLDLRLEKRWRWGRGSLTTYLDVQNAYNARHVEGTTWNYDYTQKVAQLGLPILPSLGLRGEL